MNFNTLHRQCVKGACVKGARPFTVSDDWATDKGINHLDGDLDKDGVKDSIEFFMATDPEDASSNGALVVEVLSINGFLHIGFKCFVLYLIYKCNFKGLR